jgi:hypothetical protein
MAYPVDWPRCMFCGNFALDGHLTCGRAECNEADARAELSLWREPDEPRHG